MTTAMSAATRSTARPEAAPSRKSPSTPSVASGSLGSFNEAGAPIAPPHRSFAALLAGAEGADELLACLHCMGVVADQRLGSVPSAAERLRQGRHDLAVARVGVRG